MIYTISIDWLALHCLCAPIMRDERAFTADAEYRAAGAIWEPKDSPDNEDANLFTGRRYRWRYRLMEYGTRSFSRLHLVSTPNEEGGWDDFAEVQSAPYSGILSRFSVIVRFVNRTLYLHDFWARATQFLDDNEFIFQGISRIDVCADFNQFATMTAVSLIEGFACKYFRHMGTGVGALYFNHGTLLDKIAKKREYGVQYTGLSFGTHASDLRVYLYNKSFELLTQGDKPWIRDRWTAVGLDVTKVWRLEISIKSKACKFKDKTTGNMVCIDKDAASTDNELGKIYRTLVAKKFDFRINDPKQKNVSRLERVVLFDSAPIYEHGTIRNVSPGKRFEKMFIKALYQLGDLYRGADIRDDALTAQALSFNIAQQTDLMSWLSDKVKEWDTPNHK